MKNREKVANMYVIVISSRDHAGRSIYRLPVGYLPVYKFLLAQQQGNLVYREVMDTRGCR